MLKSMTSTSSLQINEPIIISNLILALDNVGGVQTVKRLTITNKTDVSQGYSSYAYDVEGAIQNQVLYPSIDPMIFEIKYPNLDIKGQVVNL
jgi:hypothetical protein